MPIENTLGAEEGGNAGAKELVSPKEAHAASIAQHIEKTNKEELTINVRGSGEVLGTESTSPKHANIVTTSTMGLHNKEKIL